MLKVIQGDTLEAELELLDVDEEVTINSVHFSCKSLNISKDLIPGNNARFFILSCDAAETANYRIGTFSFDITVDYNDGDDKKDTVIYQAPIEVLKKNNNI